MKSNFSHVFQPIRIRGIDFKNRVTLAPPSPNLASEDGLVTHEMVNWFRMFARGGVSTIYAGNCSIDLTESRDEAIQLNMNQDRGILPMTWFVDMGKQYGCHASFELNHSGENTRFENIGHAPYSASSYITENEERAALRNHRDPIPSIEMTKEKIKETVEKFGMAAERMKRAGMDIVMVHGGHGNLISQFTSPLHNRRTDEYGGDTKARARFAIEVCDSIRRHCGEDFVIEYRISADEIAPEGMHFDETLELIGYLKDHIDILHVSAGLRTDFNMKYLSYWFQNYMMDHCFNVHYARDIKKRYPDLLVNTVGSIMSLDYAEEIIANGWADFVAMCRPLMADPDMPIKYAENRSEDRRPCLRCNTCTKHLFVPKPIWCAVNPISGMANELPDGVVPKAPLKKLKWMVHTAKQCEERGARILMNTPCTKEILDKENYDAVVIAVGGDPIVPENIPGIHKPHVVWAPDAELGKAPAGEEIVIIGAGQVGLEAAVDYAGQGKKITVIEMIDDPAKLMDSFKQPLMKKKEEDGLQIDILYGTALQEVKDDCMVAKDVKSGELKEIKADTVLLAMGIRPNFELVDELRHSCAETSVAIVGDCNNKAGSISEAVNQAFQACLHI